jgi:hypothetical protein
MDPITLLTLFAPALIDGARGLISKVTGNAGAKPANVDEVVQLMKAKDESAKTDVERLKALHELENVGEVSTWVNNVRAMQRPTVVALVLMTWVASMFVGMPVELVEGITNMASVVISYLFGERTYLKFKSKG